MQKRKFTFLFLIATVLSYSTFAEAALQFLPRYQGGYGTRTQQGGRDKVCDSIYQYACSGTGYAGGVGTSCNDLYPSCSCSTNYKWSGGSCVLKSCSDYGYSASKDNTKSCEEKTPRSGLTCYVCTACDGSTYKYACSGGLNASTQGTSNKCGMNYSECSCVEHASWNSTSGKCECGSDYKAGTTSCTLKTCEDYGYSATEDTTKNCTKQTPRSGLACWNCSDCTGTLYDCSSMANASGADTSSTSCGGKYAKCKCKDLYVWDNGVCKLGCTRNSCSTTIYPLTAQNAANASSYEKCTPSCSDESPRYKVASCNSGYNVNTSGSGCDAAPTKTCAEWLTEKGYTLVTNMSEFQTAMQDDNKEIVVMNDINDYDLFDSGINKSIYTPAYFNGEYSKCSGTPTLTGSNYVDIKNEGETIEIYPNIEVDGIYDATNKNWGTVHFYGNVSNSNDLDVSLTLIFHGNADLSGIYGGESRIELTSGASLTAWGTYDTNAFYFHDGAYIYEKFYNGGVTYKYTVTSSGSTLCGSNIPSPNTGNCNGTLIERCETVTGVQVDLKKCRDCGSAGSIPSNVANVGSECRPCTVDSSGHCTKADANVKCVWAGEEGNISSDRFEWSASTYKSCDRCGENCVSKEYREIWNCYESCNNYGASINPLAAGFYGYSSDAAFYESGKISDWCEKYPRSVCEGNNRLDPICDYDNFCDCFYHCSDSERLDRCLNTSMCK